MALTFQDITYADDLRIDLQTLQDLLAGDIDHYTLEKRYVRKDGQVVWAKLTVSLRRGADGTPQHYISVIEDIQRRKASESALKKICAIRWSNAWANAPLRCSRPIRVYRLQ